MNPGHVTPSTPFLDLLRGARQNGGFETDDALAVLLPLFRDVSAAHDLGLVAPLDGTAELRRRENGALGVDPEQFAAPTRAYDRVQQLLPPEAAAIDVVGPAAAPESPAEAFTGDTPSEPVEESAAALTRPAFLPGFTSWELAVGHHDPVTDVFSLGLLLASLACNLDFTRREDVRTFAQHRRNLFRLNPRIHPVVSRVIVQMTELDRHRRAPDVAQLQRTLQTYREQPADLDFSALAAREPRERRRLIQENLRDRLFEISRRNRLIHFRPTLQSLNLTLASVPVVMDVKNIQPEQLLVWRPELAAELSRGRALSLGSYLRIEDAPYIPGVLDKILSEARRDRAEYGFAQLRLVLCFLRWHNLKDEPEERIHSPLLLLPVELVKRKGVRDAYVLTPTTSEAEVNPALRHHLRSLYGVSLPESVDLQDTSLDELHREFQEQIRRTEPGVNLEKIDRPRVPRAHAQARQRLEQWRQRRGLRVPTPDAAAPTEAPPSPRPRPEDSLPPAEALPAPEPAGSGNPYDWDFDLCSLTLGNFHYRKMTLVRDYAQLAEGGVASPGFDSVFSLEPRPPDEPETAFPLRDQHPVIPCDAAQAAAIARARTGRSFIIQGPPGTGKSQTITNLIADYLARGKRVLFVCEKRAAIDVVFHRLRQQGLDELCCLIHDSQADKKAFIQNLKQTYEAWLAEPADETVAKTRADALHAIEHDLAALDRFSREMTSVSPAAGVTTRRLMHRLVETAERRPSLDAATEELLPNYALWLSHGALVERLERTLRMLGEEPVFARHPSRWLGRDVVLAPRPMEFVQQHLDRIAPLLERLEKALAVSGLDPELRGDLANVGAVLDYAERLRGLAGRAQLALLDPASGLSRDFERDAAAVEAAESSLAAARETTRHWRERLDPSDTRNALEAARRHEGSALRFLQPSYWRLRGAIRRRYDFDAHAVPPTLVKVLEALQADHDATHTRDELAARFGRNFGGETPAALRTLLQTVRGTEAPLPPALRALRDQLPRTPDGPARVTALADQRASHAQLRTTLQALLATAEGLDLPGLRDVLAGIRRTLPQLPDLAPPLSELADAPETLRHAVLNAPVRLDQFEAASADKTLHGLYRADAELTRFDGRRLETHQGRLAEHHRTFLKMNAAAIRAQARRRFREHVQRSSAPAAQLSEEQQAFRKDYAAGRRELEHEFGKSMRFRSIRDLAAGPTARVIQELKPVWLMSPLSISDTLPLDPDAFDVVIFDEASQIPVEEAVPAIYRAKQVIVVGDQMQLPPTTFFSSSRAPAEALETEEDVDRVEVDLDADSFLAQSSRNLPSTLLAWHYRSRYESLISFSNAAFYGGNLFTIPDRHLASAAPQPLEVTEPEQAVANVDALLARSISFHFLAHGVYEQRRNPSEARYIAETVRELLRRDTRRSIGIVAFSEAQQAEIERALDALAEADPDFGSRLEAEVNREEDDQFCGLFVKNLENVQGDERDIILLSICYGPDRSGRMLMNFGPINQRGGEKRLNVIFSRARHHMAVISSIRHDAITNDANDGANALRHFLRYAESLSRGDTAEARSVLENLNPSNRAALAAPTSRDAVVEQLAGALRQRGYAVDLNVGQSRFRCDLAVRAVDAAVYQLGVLVDTDAHYENANLLDRYLTRPGLLGAFGWEVLTVLTKDWLQEPAAVLERMERRLRGEGRAPVSGAGPAGS